MRILITAAIILALLLAACGEPDDAPAGASSPASATASVVITAEPLLTASASPAASATPPAGIAFPTMEPAVGELEALLTGTLVLRDDCLRVVYANEDPGYLIVWPYGFSLELRDGVATVIDPYGTVVGVDGQPIQLGGGDVGGSAADVGSACDGPLWWTGGTYPLGEGPQPPPKPEPPPMAVAAQPAPDTLTTTGILTLDGDCLRVTTPDGVALLVIWPPGAAPAYLANELLIARGDGAVVGWIGAELHLSGAPAETLAAVEALAPLSTPVPQGCAGPFWVTGGTLDLAEFAARDGAPAELTRDPSSESSFLAGAMQGVTLREAMRRSRLEEGLGSLQATLAAEHAETFGGLWVEREPSDPTFRIVFAFTREGEATLQPYIAGSALDGSPDVEVRQVRWSERELLAQQQEASALLASVDVNASSATMVQDNRVEVFVPWVAVAEAALANAGLVLPEAVVLIGVSDLPPPTPTS